MAYLYFALVCLAFGSNFILMDRATRYFGPLEIGFGRVTLAAALLGLLWAFLDRRQRVRWGDLGVIAAIGVLANAYPYVIQPAVISGGVAHSYFGVTVAFTPILTILVSIPILGVRPSLRQLIGVLGGFAFIVLLLYDGNLRGIAAGPLALAVSVPLCYAIGNTWLRRRLNNADPTPLSAVMLVVSSLTLGAFLVAPGGRATLGVSPPEPREGLAVAAAALVWLGAIGTGACIWAFVRMVQQRGPLFAGMVTYVVPIVAMSWGLFDGQTITLRQVVAVVGILAMVALVQAPARQAVAETTPEEDWSPEPAPAEA